MPTIVDSYSESNRNGAAAIYYSIPAYAQSFTGNGKKLHSAQFFLKRVGTPSGNIYAQLYNITGTSGTNARPNNTPDSGFLEESSPVDISTTDNLDYELVTFNFSGDYTLENGVNYCIVFINFIPYSTGNFVWLGYDSSSPEHSGNASKYDGSWRTYSGTDMCFYVYSEGSASPSLSPSISSSVSPSASLSPSRSPSLSASISPSLSPSLSASVSSSVSPSLSPSLSPSASLSPSTSPSISPSLSASISSSISSSVSPSASLSPSISASISSSVSPSASLSPSISPSTSPSLSASISPSTPDTLGLQTNQWKILYEVSSASPSLSPSISASISSSVSPSASLSPSISPSTSPSLSQSLSPSLSASISQSPSPSISASLSPSLSASLSASLSPSISPSLSPSLSQSISPSASPSISPSISPSPSPGWEYYTRGNYASLPTDDTDLENAYSAQDILDVAAADEVTVGQVAELEFIVHQFKDFVGDEENARIECRFMTTQSPTNSPVYLQIYNQITNEWETLEEDNTSDTYEYITIVHEIQDLTNYKNNGIISCRIYQEALYG